MKKRGVIFISVIIYIAVFTQGVYGAGETSQRVLSVTNDPYTSVTLTWKGDGKPQTVRFMEAGSYKGAFSGYREAAGEYVSVWKGYYRYEADMKYLTPGREYIYQIYDSRGKAVSDARNFKTPSGDEKQTKFIFIGDVQYEARERDYHIWQELLESAYEKNGDAVFILTAGDMVDSNNSRADWEVLLESGERVFSSVPVMTSIGNHETDGTIPSYLDMMALPQNGPAGLAEEFYSFDYGFCHITVMNSSFLLKERQRTDGEVIYAKEKKAVTDWLETDLKNTSAKWKIVCMHHQPYSVNDINKVYKRIRESWVPIMENYGVVLCFSGHHHLYMRTEEINGITYIQGNSGQKRSDYFDVNNLPSYIEYMNRSDSTYEVVNASRRNLEVTAYNQKGEIIDRWRYGEPEKETGWHRFIQWIKNLLGI